MNRVAYPLIACCIVPSPTKYRQTYGAGRKPKLTETFVRKRRSFDGGTQKHWDSEIKDLFLFVGRSAKA